MRLAACLLVAVAGCGAPAPQYRPAYVDPALGDAPLEAMAEWQIATGGRYPKRNISFRSAALEGCVGRTEAPSDVSLPAHVYVLPGLPPDVLRRALLHELGHVARLMPDPESGDPIHWHGDAPSVMRQTIDEVADEIGAPELAAFDRKYGR